MPVGDDDTMGTVNPLALFRDFRTVTIVLYVKRSPVIAATLDGARVH